MGLSAPTHAAGAAGDVEVGTGHVVVLLGVAGDCGRRFVDTGARVISVEVTEAQRAALAARLPAVELIDGEPGALPLPQWTADVIVAKGRWAATAACFTEFHRVLRPGGAVAVVADGVDAGHAVTAETADTADEHPLFLPPETRQVAGFEVTWFRLRELR